MRIRAFAQNTCATTDHGIFLDSASDPSARLNLADGAVRYTGMSPEPFRRGGGDALKSSHLVDMPAAAGRRQANGHDEYR
jgi:hypothetical protein